MHKGGEGQRRQDRILDQDARWQPDQKPSQRRLEAHCGVVKAQAYLSS